MLLAVTVHGISYVGAGCIYGLYRFKAIALTSRLVLKVKVASARRAHQARPAAR